jgi:hypothetical protein
LFADEKWQLRRKENRMKKALLALGLTGLICATTISHAYARWGCGAQNSGGAWGTSFAESSKASAEKLALQGCQQSRQPGEAPCHIVGCSPNIDSGDQADAKWSLQ